MGSPGEGRMFSRAAAIKCTEPESGVLKVSGDPRYRNKQHGARSSFVTQSFLPKSLVQRCSKILRIIGVRIQVDCAEDDGEIVEMVPKYRPPDVEALSQSTRFSPRTLKKLYRGFKTECPSGRLTEEVFKQIFAKFFPIDS